MTIHAIMFDLDGTLADTLGDIHAIGNRVLARFDRPPIPRDRYRYLAGQGARQLVIDALGVGEADPRVDQGVAVFRELQMVHGMDLTTPYPGVAEMLDALRSRGLKLAVLSNKPHDAAVAMMDHVFARWPFDAVRGQSDGTPHKPDPTAALEIARSLGVPPSQWMYVGDTRVDMLTAARAGFESVGVLWGFRDEAELRQSGARHIVSHPSQIVALLDR